MIYHNNDDLKKEIKKILIDENMSLTDIADKLSISRQQLNNKFSKVNLSFKDILEICESIGYKLEINIVKDEMEDSIPKQTRTNDKGKSSPYKVG